MTRIKLAYYIKLGLGGVWAEDSISKGLMRIGWLDVQLADINNGKWEKIRKQLARYHKSKSTVTSDLNRLKDIASASSDDVWITFHRSFLWWAHLDPGQVEEDETSKFRRVIGSWRKTDDNNRPLLANQIPGRIAKIQGYRGTACRVHELEALQRLLAGQPSHEYNNLAKAREKLKLNVAQAIKLLHWKDFETLVDLVFRQAGWRRKSLLGESMNYADLELEEPITGDLYQVQVKSSANLKEFLAYKGKFSPSSFRRLYFVVHTPTKELEAVSPKDNSGVELILPEHLADLIIDGGLVGWLMEKIR